MYYRWISKFRILSIFMQMQIFYWWFTLSKMPQIFVTINNFSQRSLFLLLNIFSDRIIPLQFFWIFSCLLRIQMSVNSASCFLLKYLLSFFLLLDFFLIDNNLYYMRHVIIPLVIGFNLFFILILMVCCLS